MTDFEKLRRELLEDLKSHYPPENEQTGANKFALAFDPRIVFICCEALKKYEELHNSAPVAPPAEH